jgi:hypothetical protein
MEHMDTMQRASAVSFNMYRPENVESRLSEDMDPFTEFEATRYVALVYDVTISEILTRRVLTCPLHNTVVSPDDECPERCVFPDFFRRILGITVEQFSTIPVRFDS